ncbi:hypothetical protein HRbin33_01774 [bacterium HR33]|nr:hypothetical protein HRbin33_01774 [bacterium HR33]
MKANGLLRSFGLLIAAGAVTLSACSREQWHRAPSPDDVIAAVPWFAVMKRSIAVAPYRNVAPRPPVPGTVPVDGSEPPLPITRDNLPRIDRLVNPVQRTSESIERGRDRYQIYCQVCHGPEGHGDGPVVPKFFPPPDLTAQQARSYTDGYIYTIIRHGRGIMPAYGDKIRGEDRWHLVNYIRVLQGASR